jgi:hypothetical protein
VVIEEAAKLSRQPESRVRLTRKVVASEELKAGEVKVVFHSRRMLLIFKEDERVNQIAKKRHRSIDDGII